MLTGHGLSALPSMQQSGFFTVDCSSPVTWAFNPPCWDNSPAAWAQMNAIATAVGPLPEPPPPPAPSGNFPSPSFTDQAISARVQAETQQLQDYFGQASESLSNMPAGTGGGSPGAPGINWTLIGGVLLVGVVAAAVLGKVRL